MWQHVASGTRFVEVEPRSHETSSHGTSNLTFLWPTVLIFWAMKFITYGIGLSFGCWYFNFHFLSSTVCLFTSASHAFAHSFALFEAIASAKLLKAGQVALSDLLSWWPMIRALPFNDWSALSGCEIWCCHGFLGTFLLLLWLLFLLFCRAIYLRHLQLYLVSLLWRLERAWTLLFLVVLSCSSRRLGRGTAIPVRFWNIEFWGHSLRVFVSSGLCRRFTQLVQMGRSSAIFYRNRATT